MVHLTSCFHSFDYMGRLSISSSHRISLRKRLRNLPDQPPLPEYSFVPLISQPSVRFWCIDSFVLPLIDADLQWIYECQNKRKLEGLDIFWACFRKICKGSSYHTWPYLSLLFITRKYNPTKAWHCRTEKKSCKPLRYSTVLSHSMNTYWVGKGEARSSWQEIWAEQLACVQISNVEF